MENKDAGDERRLESNQLQNWWRMVQTKPDCMTSFCLCPLTSVLVSQIQQLVFYLCTILQIFAQSK